MALRLHKKAVLAEASGAGYHASANANAVPVAGAVSSDGNILVADAAPENRYESMGGVTNINGGLMIMIMNIMYMIKCMLCQRLFPGRHSTDS